MHGPRQLLFRRTKGKAAASPDEALIHEVHLPTMGLPPESARPAVTAQWIAR
jgi:hypothetical protein